MWGSLHSLGIVVKIQSLFSCPNVVLLLKSNARFVDTNLLILIL